ncbi:Cytidine deaminase [hydrothermal vent metagenome]|uniref:cytidine deaminase n=1 Tax=hydrothermal vent metagenome TaxID=652676 RepID=A0A3B0RLF6_9ZZZZ
MKTLSKAAETVMAQAYAPYSNYLVGAAIRTVSGKIYAGCNVENAAYPLGNCAESSAIAAMIAGGEQEIAEVFVMTQGDKPGTPCGGCRQRLAEFAGPDVLVHCGLANGELHTCTMAELLPHAFDLKEIIK